MISNKIFGLTQKKRCTLLGVGPMSVNCVNSTIELANEYEIPLMLIASRRQIDSEFLGGGYVNSWTTSEFAEHVISRDKKGYTFLARDHGGPWQNDVEKKQNLSLRQAMESAKQSYPADIDSGFQVIHIDPSIDIHGQPSTFDIFNRIFELYEFCWSYAQKSGKDILFEVGTEEQSGSTNSQEELDYTLDSISNFCIKNKLPKPSFVVIQTGTRVVEMKNVGSFDTPLRVMNEIPAEILVPKMINICNKYKIRMKVHNADYLSNEALEWHPRFGIHAANVAPEFGVAESKAFLEILEENHLTNLAESFLQISYSSRKWEKWMLSNSKATDRDRALIAGHYCFSTPEFLDLKAQASSILSAKNIDLDLYLMTHVKNSILRYIKCFNII